MIAKKIVVRGKVQGVFFRKFTKMKANELHLLGYVKNLPSGEVEIFAMGSTQNLVALENWCKTGSPFSKVEGVKTQVEALQEYTDFKIKV